MGSASTQFETWQRVLLHLVFVVMGSGASSAWLKVIFVGMGWSGVYEVAPLWWAVYGSVAYYISAAVAAMLDSSY